MRVFRSSLILTVVFIVLLIFIIYQNKKSDRNDILTINPDDVSLIRIHNVKKKKELVLKRTGDDWFISDKKISNTWKIDSILKKFHNADTNKIAVVTENDELIKYGLDIPVIKLELADKSGATNELYIGDKTPTDNSWYVLIKNNNTVITLSDIYDILDLEESDLIDG